MRARAAAANADATREESRPYRGPRMPRVLSRRRIAARPQHNRTDHRCDEYSNLEEIILGFLARCQYRRSYSSNSDPLVLLRTEMHKSSLMDQGLMRRRFSVPETIMRKHRLQEMAAKTNVEQTIKTKKTADCISDKSCQTETFDLDSKINVKKAAKLRKIEWHMRKCNTYCQFRNYTMARRNFARTRINPDSYKSYTSEEESERNRTPRDEQASTHELPNSRTYNNISETCRSSQSNDSGSYYAESNDPSSYQSKVSSLPTNDNIRCNINECICATATENVKDDECAKRECRVSNCSCTSSREESIISTVKLSNVEPTKYVKTVKNHTTFDKESMLPHSNVAQNVTDEYANSDPYQNVSSTKRNNNDIQLENRNSSCSKNIQTDYICNCHCQPNAKNKLNVDSNTLTSSDLPIRQYSAPAKITHFAVEKCSKSLKCLKSNPSIDQNTSGYNTIAGSVEECALSPRNFKSSVICPKSNDPIPIDEHFATSCKNSSSPHAYPITFNSETTILHPCSKGTLKHKEFHHISIQLVPENKEETAPPAGDYYKTEIKLNVEEDKVKKKETEVVKQIECKHEVDVCKLCRCQDNNKTEKLIKAADVRKAQPESIPAPSEIKTKDRIIEKLVCEICNRNVEKRNELCSAADTELVEENNLTLIENDCAVPILDDKYLQHSSPTKLKIEIDVGDLSLNRFQNSILRPLQTDLVSPEPPKKHTCHDPNSRAVLNYLFQKLGNSNPRTHRRLIKSPKYNVPEFGQYYSDLPKIESTEIPQKVLFNNQTYDILSGNLLPNEWSNMVSNYDKTAATIDQSESSVLRPLCNVDHSDSDISIPDSLEEYQQTKAPHNNNKHDEKLVRGDVYKPNDVQTKRRRFRDGISYFIPLKNVQDNQHTMPPLLKKRLHERNQHIPKHVLCTENTTNKSAKFTVHKQVQTSLSKKTKHKKDKINEKDKRSELDTKIMKILLDGLRIQESKKATEDKNNCISKKCKLLETNAFKAQKKEPLFPQLKNEKIMTTNGKLLHDKIPANQKPKQSTGSKSDVEEFSSDVTYHQEYLPLSKDKKFRANNRNNSGQLATSANRITEEELRKISAANLSLMPLERNKCEEVQSSGDVAPLRMQKSSEETSLTSSTGQANTHCSLPEDHYQELESNKQEEKKKVSCYQQTDIPLSQLSECYEYEFPSDTEEYANSSEDEQSDPFAQFNPNGMYELILSEEEVGRIDIANYYKSIKKLRRVYYPINPRPTASQFDGDRDDVQDFSQLAVTSCHDYPHVKPRHKGKVKKVMNLKNHKYCQKFEAIPEELSTSPEEAALHSDSTQDKEENAEANESEIESYTRKQSSSLYRENIRNEDANEEKGKPNQHKGRNSISAASEQEELITLSKGWINFYLIDENNSIEEEDGSAPGDAEDDSLAICETMPIPCQYAVRVQASPQSSRTSSLPGLCKTATAGDNDFTNNDKRRSRRKTSLPDIRSLKIANNSSGSNSSNSSSRALPKLKANGETEPTEPVSKARKAANKEKSILLSTRTSTSHHSDSSLDELPTTTRLKRLQRPKTYHSSSNNMKWSFTLEGNKTVNKKSQFSDIEMQLLLRNPRRSLHPTASNHSWKLTFRSGPDHDKKKSDEGDSQQMQLNYEITPSSFVQLNENSGRNDSDMSSRTSSAMSNKGKYKKDKNDTDIVIQNVKRKLFNELNMGIRVQKTEDLTVKGSTITPEKKPRVPTMSERDVTRKRLLKQYSLESDRSKNEYLTNNI